MEISVGFADKAEEYYMERGYIWEQSMLGRVYYPAEIKWMEPNYGKTIYACFV